LNGIVLSELSFDFGYIDCSGRVDEFGGFESTTKHIDSDDLAVDVDFVPGIGGVEDQAWFRVEESYRPIRAEAGEDDEFRWEGSVKVDQRLGFERKHVGGRESQGEVEEDGMGPGTSKVVHPVIQLVVHSS
jgi:hypothetical protein